MVNGLMKSSMAADNFSLKTALITKELFATVLLKARDAIYLTTAAFIKEKFITTKRVEREPI